jgi:hypothetical protein
MFYETLEETIEEAKRNPIKAKARELGLPELFSMQFNRKIYNTRLSNYAENLGGMVKGITKDIEEIGGIVIHMKKYGT